MLRTNKPEIPALFLNEKQTEVCSSSLVLPVTNLWHYLYQQEKLLSSSFQHSIMTRAWVRKQT